MLTQILVTIWVIWPQWVNNLFIVIDNLFIVIRPQWVNNLSIVKTDVEQTLVSPPLEYH